MDSPASAQIESVLGKLVAGGAIASPDDASLYAKDDAIRSNQGDANPWVVAFFERASLAALAFVRPAPPIQATLRVLARGGAPAAVLGPDTIPIVRAGSAATLEQALVDRNLCLVRGTGPDGDEVSVATCSALSLHDAYAKFRRIEAACLRGKGDGPA
jgi:hypothetical protein